MKEKPFGKPVFYFSLQNSFQNVHILSKGDCHQYLKQLASELSSRGKIVFGALFLSSSSYFIFKKAAGHLPCIYNPINCADIDAANGMQPQTCSFELCIFMQLELGDKLGELSLWTTVFYCIAVIYKGTYIQNANQRVGGHVFYAVLHKTNQYDEIRF